MNPKGNRTMKSHRFDAISFISGLVVALVGLVFLVPQTPVDLIDAVTSLGAWFWPVLLLAVGLAILVPVFLTQRDEKDEPGALISQSEASDDLP